ncbi:MAG: SPOR domain-containing protein [Alphaproteobacteria bacterium]|nr:SPOR domain-containing protein [Alphaproteobacteria bacterium]
MAEFDTSYRTPRHRPGMDPNTRRLAIIAGGIGAALLVMVGAWSLTGGKSGGGVPVVEADSRPLRVKPDSTQQGPEIDSPASPVGKQALAPTPEAPKPEALRAAGEKAAAEKLAAEKAAEEKIAAEKAAAEKAAAERQIAAAPRAATPPAATPPAAAPVVPAPVQPVVSAQAARPPSQPAVLTAPTPLAAAPLAAAPPPPPARAPAAAPAPAASSGTQVQLAAVTSEQAALSEWSRLEKRMPDVLGGRRPAVVKTERDGKTFYRLRTGGFTDAGQASSFCEKVRAKGGVCSVASF